MVSSMVCLAHGVHLHLCIGFPLAYFTVFRVSDGVRVRVLSGIFGVFKSRLKAEGGGDCGAGDEEGCENAAGFSSVVEWK